MLTPPQKTGVTALMEAAKAGSLELVRTILQKGGNPNALDMKHLTAVHYAAMGGFFEVWYLLNQYQFFSNQKDDKGSAVCNIEPLM